MEEAPHCDPTEVSKAEAVRLLLPQIQVMQSEGYGLAHIVSWLSSKGVAITFETASALRKAKLDGR
jgi:hypothetical protein